MPRSGAGIALIKRPVDQPVEEHRGGARADHADENQKEKAMRWSAVCRYDESAERERECKDRMRKANEPEKTADGTFRGAL